MKIHIHEADIQTMRCNLEMKHFIDFNEQDKRKKQLFQQNIAKTIENT